MSDSAEEVRVQALAESLARLATAGEDGTYNDVALEEAIPEDVDACRLLECLQAPPCVSARLFFLLSKRGRALRFPEFLASPLRTALHSSDSAVQSYFCEAVTLQLEQGFSDFFFMAHHIVPAPPHPQPVQRLLLYLVGSNDFRFRECLASGGIRLLPETAIRDANSALNRPNTLFFSAILSRILNEEATPEHLKLLQIIRTQVGTVSFERNQTGITEFIPAMLAEHADIFDGWITLV